MSSFWDDPANNPPDPWPATGVITRMAARDGRFGLQLCVELDGDARDRWCPTTLWRALRDARVEIGDKVDVRRTDDGRGNTRWHIDRTAVKAPESHAGASTGPSW